MHNQVNDIATSFAVHWPVRFRLGFPTAATVVDHRSSLQQCPIIAILSLAYHSEVVAGIEFWLDQFEYPGPEETAFEKKTRETLERHRQREAAKQLTAVQKSATAIIAKVTPVLTSIEAVMSKSEMALISKELQDPIHDAKLSLTKAVDTSNTIINAVDYKACPPLPNMKLVCDSIAKVKKTINLVTGMFSMIAKSRSF